MDYKNYHRDKTYKENESLFKNIFEKRVNLARKFKKKPGSVLEIGASNGVMLDIFKQNDWETWGVEPSKNANIAQRKGHKIINDFFEKASLPKNYFDLVIANHTLEHLDNPLSILKKVHNILKKDGLVFIDVPNAGGIGSEFLGDKWPYKLPKEHKHQFTKNSLQKIFEEADFKVIHFESRSGIFEFSNPILELWQSLIGLKKRFFTNIILFPYSLVTTLLNRGDSVSMIGRK
ncbi:MAG: class I SAM-dependent methyltransferase [Candidatus Woesebacteria bacterium]|nr:MAG: class I SAM-dependent methyltransferase [Candidatus Woesebacteria bacterium]